MWMFHIFAVLLFALWISYKTKETFVDVLPLTVCGLILVLYGLAFFRMLSLIDYISSGVCMGILLVLFRADKEKRNEFLQHAGQQLRDPITLMVLGTILTVSFLVQGRIALWWDDINFWATDVKSIFYLDGFAGKYGNVAPEFGDYPPGVQLFKWWFLHFSPEEFKEGLMFAGYYSLNLILAAPLFSGMSRYLSGAGKYLFALLGGICLFLFPSTVETFYLEGSCADLPMGIAYGLFLWGVIDRNCKSKVFYYARLILTLSFVMLCKSVGFEWASFGMLFFLIYRFTTVSKEERKETRLPALLVLGLPWLIEGSWLLSCLLKRRVAKLTGAGIKMAASGKLPDTAYKGELWDAFVKGFTITPIHRDHTLVLDLSVLMVILLIIAGVFLLKKRNLITGTESWLLGGLFLISGLLSYGVNLLAHFTIFAGEMQYLEANAMAASLERYGVPFTIGALYLLWQLLVERKQKLSAYVFCMAFVLLCAYYPGAYQALWGYRDTRTEQLNERSAMSAGMEKFQEETAELWRDKGTRVLYLRDNNAIHWVKDTYINYEVSPLGVVYGGIDPKNLGTADMERAIRESHARYLYTDTVEGNPKEVFAPMTEDFSYETLYEIIEEQGLLKLAAVP